MFDPNLVFGGDWIFWGAAVVFGCAALALVFLEVLMRGNEAQINLIQIFEEYKQRSESQTQLLREISATQQETIEDQRALIENQENREEELLQQNFSLRHRQLLLEQANADARQIGLALARENTGLRQELRNEARGREIHLSGLPPSTPSDLFIFRDSNNNETW